MSQGQRRRVEAGPADLKIPWEGQEEPARNIRWEQGEGEEMGPQNTAEAIRLFAEGWIAGRDLIVVTDGGMNQSTPLTGPFSTPFCHLSTEWEEQVTTCGWALAFDENATDRLPMHLSGGRHAVNPRRYGVFFLSY